jgi:hypothetical protein
MTAISAADTRSTKRKTGIRYRDSALDIRYLLKQYSVPRHEEAQRWYNVKSRRLSYRPSSITEPGSSEGLHARGLLLALGPSLRRNIKGTLTLRFPIGMPAAGLTGQA